MNTLSSASSLSADTTLQDLLRARKQAGETPEETLAVAEQAPEAARQATTVFDPDKYTKAREAASQAGSNMANRQNAILAASLAEVNSLSESDMRNYAKRSLIGRKAARRMQQEMQQTVTEESERNLKEARKNVEERAQEVLAPTDAAGNPLPQDSAPAAPAPAEIDTAPIPASTVPSGATPAPEQAETTEQAPASPSLNVVV